MLAGGLEELFIDWEVCEAQEAWEARGVSEVLGGSRGPEM